MTLLDPIAVLDRVAEAPGGVGRIRELILDHAVRGRLTECGSDQIASLSDFASAGKKTSRRSNRSTRLPPVLPFEAPSNWLVTPLDTVAQVIRGVTYKKHQASDAEGEGLLPLLRAHNIQAGIVLQRLIYVPEELVGPHKVLAASDVLMCIASGSLHLLGKSALVQGPLHACFGAFTAVVRPAVAPLGGWLALYLTSPTARTLLMGAGRGIGINNLKTTTLAALPVPVPPVSEQERIIARVDELMALLDDLENAQGVRERTRVKARDSALGALCDAQIDSELAAAWNRIAQNMNALIICPADTGALRGSIMDLAVRGRLSDQDPGEDPARELLARIQAVRAELAPATGKKIIAKLQPLRRQRCSHRIPASWEWCRLGDLVLEFRYGTSRKCTRDVRGVPVLRIPNVRDAQLDIEDLKYAELSNLELEKLSLSAGDLLLVRSNGSERLVGMSAVVSRREEGYAYAGYLIRARLPLDLVHPPYIQLALSSTSVRRQIEGPIRTTSGVKNINTTELANLTFPLPPVTEQRRIAAETSRLVALLKQLHTGLEVESRAAAHLGRSLAR